MPPCNGQDSTVERQNETHDHDEDVTLADHFHHWAKFRADSHTNREHPHDGDKKSGHLLTVRSRTQRVDNCDVPILCNPEEVSSRCEQGDPSESLSSVFERIQDALLLVIFHKAHDEHRLTDQAHQKIGTGQAEDEFVDGASQSRVGDEYEAHECIAQRSEGAE